MKLVRIWKENRPVWGVVKGDLVYTLSEAPYEKLCYDGQSVPFSSCRLLAPCLPTKIVCVGKIITITPWRWADRCPTAPFCS
jgi:hypothetical protein